MGEFTAVIAPTTEAVGERIANDYWEQKADLLLAEGLSARDVVRALMVLGGLSKSQAFDIAKSARSAREARQEETR